MRAVTLATMVLALGATATRAQDASDYEQASRGERLALYDLPSAEDVAARGGRAVRVYVDGAFTGLLPALVLERGPGPAPRLAVVSSRWDGPRWRRVVMTAKVPPADWKRLSEDAAQAVADWQAFEAERAKPPPPPAPSTAGVPRRPT